MKTILTVSPSCNLSSPKNTKLTVDSTGKILTKLEETQIFEAIPLPVSPYQSLTLDRFNVLEQFKGTRVLGIRDRISSLIPCRIDFAVRNVIVIEHSGVWVGIDGPKIFNQPSSVKVEGKTTYPTEYSLDFLREGDTYTLRSVDGTSADKLNLLYQNRDNWNHTMKMYSNDFWPMDKRWCGNPECTIAKTSRICPVQIVVRISFNILSANCCICITISEAILSRSVPAIIAAAVDTILPCVNIIRGGSILRTRVLGIRDRRLMR